MSGGSRPLLAAATQPGQPPPADSSSCRSSPPSPASDAACYQHIGSPGTGSRHEADLRLLLRRPGGWRDVRLLQPVHPLGTLTSVLTASAAQEAVGDPRRGGRAERGARASSGSIGITQTSAHPYAGAAPAMPGFPWPREWKTGFAVSRRRSSGRQDLQQPPFSQRSTNWNRRAAGRLGGGRAGGHAVRFTTCATTQATPSRARLRDGEATSSAAGRPGSSSEAKVSRLILSAARPCQPVRAQQTSVLGGRPVAKSGSNASNCRSRRAAACLLGCEAVSPG